MGLLGVDIGTGSCKAVVVDPSGTVLCSAAVEIATSRPHPGWAEQHPDDWLAAAVMAVRRLDSEVVRRVDAVGLTASTHNAALLDERGRALRPAIMWTDTRSAAEAEDLQRSDGARIFSIGMHRPSPTWTLSQLRWIATHEPAVLTSTRRVVFTKDFVRRALTGDEFTDPADAQGTLLYDARRGKFSPTLCALIPLEPAALPTVRGAHTVAGFVTAAAAAAFGLPVGIPVVVGTSDTAAESLAVGACRPGHAAVKLATSGTVNIITQVPAPSAVSLTYPYVADDLWYTCLATSSAAASIRWFRDQISPGSTRPTYEEIDAAAISVPPGAGGVVFHPYLSGERSPHWDPYLRASFVGLQAGHGWAHLARAVLEGVAFSVRECLDAAEQLAGPAIELRLTGGGSRSALWRSILASVLDRPLQLFDSRDAALGAAMLAGIGTRTFANLDEAVAACARPIGTVEPDPASSALYGRLMPIYADVRDGLTATYHRLERTLATTDEPAPA